MSSRAIIVFVLVNVISACLAQTFHYSHGWTNGKRSGNAPLTKKVHQRSLDNLNDIFDVEENDNDNNVNRGLRAIEFPGPVLVTPVQTSAGGLLYKFYAIERRED